MSKTVKYILIILLVNISFFVLAAWLLPIRFETSDDITMANLVNGVWNGNSDPHLIFQNIIYGWFLQLLYSKINCIEWYSVCMAIAHIVAMTIITQYIFRKIDDKLLKYLVLVLFFVLWVYLIAKFQFTSTTALLSFSGILLLLDRKFLWGGLVLLLASFMRFNAAMMIGLFMSPIFIFTYKSEWKNELLPKIWT